MNLFPMDPYELERIIGIPVSDWPGNCHAVACAVRDHAPVEGMRVARGHWYGPTARNSIFKGPLSQHSWLICSDGRVLDPTRFAFEDPRRPSIYLGPSDFYDEGGLMMKQKVPPPLFGGSDALVTLVERMGEANRTEIKEALQEHTLSNEQLAEKIRLYSKDDPDRLPHVLEVFTALQKANLKMVIPLDSWVRVMEPETVFCRSGANNSFDLPPAPDYGETETLSLIFDRFLSLEDRPNLESELEGLGLSMNSLWGALDELKLFKDMPIAHLPRSTCDLLSVVAGDLLGAGFGKELEVERFARSIGAAPLRLKALLEEFGRRSGYDLSWDVRQEKDWSWDAWSAPTYC